MKNNHGLSVKDKSRSVEVKHFSASFSGPLPHPEILKGYELVLSGSAERILKMAENQSIHRQEIEKKVIESNIKNERMGMWMSFILAILLMSFGVYLIKIGYDGKGFITVLVPIIIAIVNYFYNRKKEERILNKEEK